MAEKRKSTNKRFARFSSMFSTGSKDSNNSGGQDGDSQKQTIEELEKKVEHLTNKCAELDFKLRKEQAKSSEWKKQIVNSLVQKYGSSASASPASKSRLYQYQLRSVSTDSLLLDHHQHDEPQPQPLILLNPEDHPFLQQQIVAHLMKFLKKDDLYRARFVCTLWNDEGRQEIRRRIEAHIQLDVIDNLKKFQQIQLLRITNNIFYHNFFFHYTHQAAAATGNEKMARTDTDKRKIHEEFTKVLRIIGPHAKKITLTLTDNEILYGVLHLAVELESLTLTVGVNLLATFHPSKEGSLDSSVVLSKLKRLTLDVYSPKEQRITSKYEDNFLAILKLLLQLCSTKLAKLHLLIHGTFIDAGNHIGNSIMSILIKSKPLKLVDLVIGSFPIDKKWILELATGKFEFNSLSLGILDWKTTFDILPTLWRSKSMCKLRKIVLHVHSKPEQYSESWTSRNLDELISNGFRYLRSLTSFELIPSKFLVEGRYTFERLHSSQSHYLANPIIGIPVLKGIEVEPQFAFREVKIDSSPSSSPEAQHRLNRYRFVNSLTLKRETSTIDILRKCLRLLGDSLTKLEFTPHDSACLILIWNGLQNLEQLKIHVGADSMITDLESAIIGIHAADCKKLRDDSTICFLLGVTDGKVLKHLQNQPSIRQLRKLRSLDTGNEKYLSDLSVLLCFLKMKSLTSLKFRFKGSYSSIRLLKSDQPGMYLETWK